MKNFRALLSFCILLFLLPASALKAQSIVQIQNGKPSSIRGLSVVDDSVAWISGSSGYVAITHNGGKTWQWQQIKGFEKAEFRDIEAFSDKSAVIMSSGTPALILKTTDGGISWQEKYRNADTAYFFDAMAFADAKHGFIVGDPIKNKFVLMETRDGGNTWAEMKNAPNALPGEAAFAASGTCLEISKTRILKIVSGGTQSRMISTSLDKINWEYAYIPVKHGQASQGAFSIATGRREALVVGGDYANDKKTDSIAAEHSVNTLTVFHPCPDSPKGFQSCVTYINDDTFVSTGTPGSNITRDGGNTWKQIDTTSFNVCGKAKHGKLILFAGNGGKTGILKL